MGERVGKHKSFRTFLTRMEYSRKQNVKMWEDSLLTGYAVQVYQFNRIQIMSGYEILTKLNPWQKSHWFFWDQDLSGHTVSKCWPFLKSSKYCRVFYTFIHWYSNKLKCFWQGNIHRWHLSGQNGLLFQYTHCRWKHGQRSTLQHRQTVAKEGAL